MKEESLAKQTEVAKEVPATWALMWVKVRPDGTPAQPLEVRPHEAGAVDLTSPAPTIPTPAEPGAAGSSKDELVSLILSMRHDPAAWKQDLPEVRLKAIAVEIALPAAKGEGTGVRRTMWPKELNSMEYSLKGFEHWLEKVKILKATTVSGHLRNMSRIFSLLEIKVAGAWRDIKDEEAEDVKLLAAFLPESFWAKLLGLDILDVKYRCFGHGALLFHLVLILIFTTCLISVL